MEHAWEAAKKVYIKGQGHMTKTAAMAINSKTFRNLPLQNKKAYDFETWLESSGRGTLHKVFINHDPWMTLTYFTARSM